MKEHKRSKNLLQAVKFFETLLSRSNDGILITDVNQNIIEVNDTFCSIIGHNRRSVIESNLFIWLEMFFNDAVKDWIKLEKETKSKQSVSHFEFQFKSETKHHYYDVNASFVENIGNEDGGVIISNWHDITKQKQIEKALSESDKKYKLITDNTTDSIWTMDHDLNFTYLSPSTENLFGYTLSEWETLEWNKFIHPDYMDTVMLVFDRLHNDSDAVTQTAISLVYHKDGAEMWVEFNATPIYDDEDKLISVVGVTRDITERKHSEIEKEKLKEQLTQAQKMEAIGTLAGGIAHDFNNILGVIMGYTDLTMDDLSDSGKVIKNLQRVMTASERAKEMVEQILAFSRKSEGTMKSVNIGKIIKEVSSFLRTSIPTTIEIKTKIDEEISFIMGNHTQINQVLMNLCTNSAYAMKENGGLLNIGLKKIMLEADESKSLKIKQGAYQVLTVSDTGLGIDKDVIDRIFEPYFTTKNIDEGTGMGLAVIYGIVKNHGGEIKVYSESGKGTLFDVYFPVPDIDNNKESASTDTDQPEITGNNEMILLVDDELMLAELGIQMLQSLGYQVESKNSSIEALIAFKTDPDKYDLIVTDMTMPKMTGSKLAAEIHKIRSDIPVILCTGFSNKINKSNYKAKGISELIMKPVVKRELAEAINKVLKKKRFQPKLK